MVGARVKALALVGSVALGMTPAIRVEAQEVYDGDIQSLLAECEATTPYCIGYVSGISAVMGLNCLGIRSGKGGDPDAAADTDGPSVGALMKTFTNWANARPEKWNLNGGAGVLVALRETFPCT